MQVEPARTRTSSTREARLGAAPAVLLGGAVTIALALAGVWLADRAGENVMGWYADYVLPVGAILVGLVASSGFGLASWFSGTKVSGLLLLAVVVMLFGGYCLAQYVSFRLAFPEGVLLPSGRPAGFLEYYDAVTRNFSWVEHGKAGEPLGALGYLVRLGEVIGFTGGGVLVPVALRKMPYCEACRAYKRSPLVARIPAGIVWKRVNPKRKPQEAQAQEAQAAAAAEAGQAKLQALLAAAKVDGPTLAQAAGEAGSPRGTARAVERLSARIWVKLVHCRRCGQGDLAAALVTGQGKAVRRAPLSQTPVDPEVVRAFLRAPQRGKRT